MTRWYWREIVKGTLIEEFYAVPRGTGCGPRSIDGIIIKGEEFRIARKSEVDVTGKDIVVIQAKDSRLGMNVMGQAFFSAQLMRAFKPRSIESIALVAKDDFVLRPLFEQYPGLKVVVCPEEVVARAKMRFSVRAPGLAEGRYSETEVLKFIEAGRIDRTAECRLAQEEKWKTVGDHLPPS